MTRLQSAISYVRELVNGVRALPELGQVLRAATQAVKHAARYELAELAQRLDDAERKYELLQSARDDYMRRWKVEETESRKLRVELSAEREAHEETAGILGDEARTAMRLAKENRDLLAQLSAARADLEELTRWVPGDKSPLMGKARVTVSYCDDYSDAIIVESTDAYMYRFCRPIPESLASWKAQKVGSDGL